MTRKEILYEVMKLPISRRFVAHHTDLGVGFGYLIGPKMDDNFWTVAWDLTDKPDTQVCHHLALTYDGQE